MAYAIIRIGKLKNRGVALSATAHNYRTQDTPNADPAQRSRNQELLNHHRRNYWDLATERIQQLPLSRLRKDAVRCVEVLMTASSEGFAREQSGQAKDMRGSQWVQDNLHFLERKFGRENLVSFTLHQDETTPHIHAVLVPVTREQRLHEGKRVGEAIRLSCRELFSPGSLRQLQTEYAEAMAPHGFERGIKYSTAIHQDVRRHYGAQQMTKQALAEVAAPLVPQPHELTPMKALERLSPQAYIEREQARMNAYLAEQVAVVNAKLEQVAAVAAANALAHEKVRQLEKQLAAARQRQEQTTVALQQKTREQAKQRQALAALRGQTQQLIIRVVQGETLPPKLLDWAARQQEQSRIRAEQVVTDFLQGSVAAGQLPDVLHAKGYTLYQSPGQEQLLVRENSTQVRFPLTALRPSGEDLFAQLQRAVERTQQRDELAQPPGILQVVITAGDTQQAERIQAELEKAGATIWQVQAGGQQRLRVSYAFDWKTVEPISRVLERVQRLPGTTLEESNAHRVIRTNAVESLARNRTPRNRSAGLSL